ncbi:hypothetical protein ACFVU0_34760 [Streptomyces sp. NPDC058122]|uniref:hypothetical protein n=1 Tax=Streptomyces sp. NPDC058122 TaxID=3346349 RepID=UPI0036EBADE5
MSEQIPSVRERQGVIGTRQLVAVQTFSIARLTSHPVVVVPGTFVAVTGRGPKDSNESGKTSFLAAVALLLGDPEWRLAGGGSVHAPKLLFEPITAGASPEVNEPASVGYVAGVFAEPEDPRASAHTVWLQISAKSPHIEVRHQEGVHLLVGGDDRSQHELAPEFFRALGGKPLGVTEYAEVLYGRAPRLLAYIVSRGGMRSRPSLLKLDAGTFTPVQIGEALLDLTGKAAMLARDEEARAHLDETQKKLAAKLAEAEKSYRDEEIILQSVGTRERARVETGRAQRFWRLASARAALDAVVYERRIAGSLARVEDDLAGLETQHGVVQGQLAQARDTGHLQRVASTAQMHSDGLRREVEEASEKLGQRRGSLERAEKDRRQARRQAEEYAGPSPAELAELVKKQEARQMQVGAELLLATKRVSTLEGELAEAREGRTGQAGAVLRALEGVTSHRRVGLMATTRVHPRARAQWEARLAPWREAVCVAAEGLEDATGAVSDLPGTLLICGPAGGQVLDAGPGGGLPEGILDADPLAVPFLHALAGASEVTVPPHAWLSSLGVRIIGGFEKPIAGQEDICAHLEGQLRQARVEHGELGSAVALHQRRIIELRRDIKRAEAQELVQQLGPRIRELEEDVAQRIAALPGLRTSAQEASDAAHEAQTAFRSAEERAERFVGVLRKVKEEMVQAKRRREKLEELRRGSDVDGVRMVWTGSAEEALEELGWSCLPDDEPGAEPAEGISAGAVVARDGEHQAEVRTSGDLRSEGRSRLAAALTRLSADTATTGVATAELADALRHHEAHTGDPHYTVFRASLTALRTWLDEFEERDAGAREQVEVKRQERERERRYLEDSVEDSRKALAETQGSIKERVHSALDRISDRLNVLYSKEGYEAELCYSVREPEGADGRWVCHVVPRWQRNPGGALLAYDAPTNTAQEKLFSIHLVLAALLAAPDSRGRVLILDELGDSLGAEHRREVIAALRDAAREHGITVLATCQDGLMTDVGPMCGQVLQFRYYSKSDPLNRPTAMFGFDANRRRVRLTLDDLVASRL